MMTVARLPPKDDVRDVTPCRETGHTLVIAVMRLRKAERRLMMTMGEVAGKR
jgi:hypothetical protein